MLTTQVLSPSIARIKKKQGFEPTVTVCFVSIENNLAALILGGLELIDKNQIFFDDKDPSLLF